MPMCKKNKKTTLGLVCLWICLLFACTLVSCTKTVYTPIESTRVDTIYQTLYKTDSVAKIDSVYIKEVIKGDTVYLEKTKYHFRDRTKMVTDTIVEKVVEVKEIPIEVEKKLSVWDKVRIGIADCFLAFVVLVLVGFAIFWVIKKK